MNKLLVMLLAVAAGVLFVADASTASIATKRVTIVHVQKGCHVWSLGSGRTPTLHLALKRGGALAVVNQDVDMHMLHQASGPTINTGPFLMMNQRVVLRFAKPGIYRFHTRVADMRGMPEAETIGPDNKLLLTVHVT